MNIRGIIWIEEIVEKLAWKPHKANYKALIVSARDMSNAERRRYDQQ